MSCFGKYFSLHRASEHSCQRDKHTAERKPCSRSQTAPLSHLLVDPYTDIRRLLHPRSAHNGYFPMNCLAAHHKTESAQHNSPYHPYL